MDRAYSILTIKSLDEEKREIVGIATTPAPDRMGDIVESKGASFKLPIPLLWQHNRESPIGSVLEAQVTAGGIRVRASIAKVDEPGVLKDRLDEAWQSMKSGLVRGLSIGFKPIETARMEDGSNGLRFLKWLWLELSAVTIPANGECSISVIRSIDTSTRALSGTQRAEDRTVRLADASANLSNQSRSKFAMNTQERIRAFEAKREASRGRMSAILAATEADGNRSFDDGEAEEFKNLKGEVKACDDMLVELRDFERQALPTARPVAGNDASQALQVRGGAVISAGRPQVPKGTAFVRYAAALALARGNIDHAMRIARRWKDSTPEVLREFEVKADVGTTTDTDWAAPLVYPTNLSSEFLELLTPMTILGRLNLNKVPFNVRIPIETGSPLVSWVGEGLQKPVGQSAYDSILLGHSKVAGIVVITEELARLSSPSAEALLRTQLTRSIARYLDQQLLDPAVAAVAGVNPASLTNAVTPIPASGTDAAALLCDLGALFDAFLSANLSTSGVALVMSDVMAARIGLMRNALGQPEFPGVNSDGGNLGGLRIITSGNVPGDSSGSIIVAIKEDAVFLADDGGVTLSASGEATLNITGSGEAAAHSLWQRNEIAIRAERWAHWKKGRDEAVQYIENAAYSTCA